MMLCPACANMHEPTLQPCAPVRWLPIRCSHCSGSKTGLTVPDCTSEHWLTICCGPCFGLVTGLTMPACTPGHWLPVPCSPMHLLTGWPIPQTIMANRLTFPCRLVHWLNGWADIACMPVFQAGQTGILNLWTKRSPNSAVMGLIKLHLRSCMPYSWQSGAAPTVKSRDTLTLQAGSHSQPLRATGWT